jgi:hypothetical protein
MLKWDKERFLGRVNNRIAMKLERPRGHVGRRGVPLETPTHVRHPTNETVAGDHASSWSAC